MKVPKKLGKIRNMQPVKQDEEDLVDENEVDKIEKNASM